MNENSPISLSAVHFNIDFLFFYVKLLPHIIIGYNKYLLKWPKVELKNTFPSYTELETVLVLIEQKVSWVLCENKTNYKNN